MRRLGKWLLVGAAALLVLPAVLVALALGLANTPPGARLIERQVASLTGGTVQVFGVSASLPGGLRIGRIELHDAAGLWLTVEDAALVWSPTRLLGRVAQIDDLTARRIAVLRLPKSEESSSGGSGGFSLPVRVQARHILASRIEIAPPVLGTALALALEGRADVAAFDDASLDATLRDLDTSGSYHLAGALTAAKVLASLAAQEPAQGMVAKLAGVPSLGALTLQADLSGPRDAVASRAKLAAGPLQVALSGVVDIDRVAGTLDLTATAPAIAPSPGLAFQGLDLAAHVAGPITAPNASGHLVLDGLAGAGASMRRLVADISGSRGAVGVHATAEGVRLPGPQPGLIEADPVKLAADLRLDEAELPFRLDLQSRLLTLSGSGHVAPHLAATAHLILPDLAPLTALGGIVAKGSTALDIVATQAATSDATIDGVLSLTDGPAPALALIGQHATVGVTVALAGPQVTVSRLKLDGAALHLAATGRAGDELAAEATIGLPDLAALAATLRGRATLHVAAHGKSDDLAADAELVGDVGTAGTPPGKISATLRATGLPNTPAGEVVAEGELDGAPLRLRAHASRADGGASVLSIEQADWRSAHAEGGLRLAAGATLPTGRLALRMTRLDDLRRLVGQAVGGSVEGAIEFAERQVTAKFLASRLSVAGASVDRAALDAKVADPLAEARVDAGLTLTGVRSNGLAANGRVSVAGPRRALDIRAQADAPNVSGAPASLAARAVLDTERRTVAVSSLVASARGQTMRLLAPALVAFGGSVSVDRLRIGFHDAVLDVAGRMSPTLDVTASLKNARADLAALLSPSYAADGIISADARLTGTPARPAGSVRLDATGLHLRTGPGSALPPAAIAARATLAGRTARLDVTASEGGSHLSLTGTAPLDPAAALDLRATGAIDLAVLDPLLAAGGRRVRGHIAIDAGVTGSIAAPHPSGTVRLTAGEVQDFTAGVHIDRIQAVLAADGDAVRVQQLDGRAGTGTLSASGTIGVAGAMPVDLHVQAKGATPLASALLTALLDADLSLRGTLAQRLDLGGSVTIRRAEIRVPERLPASVPVLDVVRPGAAPPPPAAAPVVVGLALTLSAPGQIFVRGRGLDAELAGNLRIGGTTAQPQPIGTFTMRRGSFSVAGKTLTFSTGEVGFNGSGKIDPTLNFVASSTSSSVVATLAVGGTASDPKITLSSVPDLPQDEVLAHLLFGQSAAQLGPFQLAEIAAALAQFSGVAGGGFDPLNSLRNGLGLDRLSVGGGGNGASPDVEAGRYVAQGVYVGAKQATSGSGTQALVQIDLTKGLKLESTVGTGGGSAQGSAQSSSGSSGTGVGITYQFEY